MVVSGVNLVAGHFMFLSAYSTFLPGQLQTAMFTETASYSKVNRSRHLFRLSSMQDDSSKEQSTES